jgi:hypothetical protein
MPVTKGKQRQRGLLGPAPVARLEEEGDGYDGGQDDGLAASHADDFVEHDAGVLIG